MKKITFYLIVLAFYTQQATAEIFMCQQDAYASISTGWEDVIVHPSSGDTGNLSGSIITVVDTERGVSFFSPFDENYEGSCEVSYGNLICRAERTAIEAWEDTHVTLFIISIHLDQQFPNFIQTAHRYGIARDGGMVTGLASTIRGGLCNRI